MQMQEKNKILTKGNQWLLSFALVIVLAPYFILCFYSHPVADDYTFNVSSPFWHSQWQLYLHWNGRYSSDFMALANPILYGSLIGYRLISLLLLFLVPASILFLISSTIGKSLSMYIKLIAATIGAALILGLMPSLPEGIYWYSGSVTYILGCVMAMFYFGIVIGHTQRTVVVNKIFHIGLSIVLLFLAVGFNEVQMLVLVFAHFILWIGLKKEARFRSFVFVMLVFCILFSCLVFFSPGNHFRSGYFPNSRSLFNSLFMSMLQMLRFFFTWVSYAPLIIASILFAPLSFEINKRSALSGKLGNYKPFTLFVLIWVILFLCIFPAYWSTGILGQHRTLNTACFFFVLIWFLLIHSIYSKNNLAEKITQIISPSIRFFLTLLLFATLLLSGNSGTAIMELASGKITGFDKEMNNRVNILSAAKNKGITDVTIPPLQNKPQSLFVLDIQPDCNHWINQQYANFFGLKKVCSDSLKR